MERPDNLMVINGVFLLDGKMTAAELRAVIEERLLGFDRFRLRVDDPDARRPRWIEDPYFDITRHVVEGPRLVDQAEMREAIEARIDQPLSFAHSPWQIHVFESDARTLLLCRIHHCIADGIALVRVLLGIADEHAASRPSRPDLLGEAKRLVRELGSVMGHPRRSIQWGSRALQTFVDILVRTPDPPSILRGPLSKAKRVAWSRGFDLGTVKRIAKERGVKVNDVLTSAVSGALRQYLEAHGETPRDLRVMVPVNLRPADAAAKLGNYFGIVMLPLPLAQGDGLARIDETRRRMNAAKEANEAIVAFGLLQTLGQLSRVLEAPFIRFFGTKASAVMTNVPGPTERLHIRGHAIRWLMFWVPQSAGLALGLSVLSYAGEVFFGIMTDAGIIEHPEEIVDAFEAELEALDPSSGSVDPDDD